MPGYISEVDFVSGTATEFVEIAVPTGTDVTGYSIYVYGSNGSIAQNSKPLSTLQSTNAGQDVYIVNNTTSGLVNITYPQAVALVDGEGNVVQFISFNGNIVTGAEGPAVGLTSTSIGVHANGQSLQSDDGGASYYVQTIPNPGTIPGAPVCYAPGTMIDTPDGPRTVETLSPGDLVMTLDHGPQPIRWTRSGNHPLEDAEDEAKPVQIKAGALGPNLPARDLIVSPQHRILVGGAGQLQPVFASEAFAPAKSLTSEPGIRHMKGKTQITWTHFACDRHEVVFANGCLSESLLLGPMVVNGLNATERSTLTEIFGVAPTPDAALNGPPARDCLTVGALKRQLARHRKEKGRLVAKEIRKWDVDLAMEQYEAERIGKAQSLAQSRRMAL